MSDTDASSAATSVASTHLDSEDDGDDQRLLPPTQPQQYRNHQRGGSLCTIRHRIRALWSQLTLTELSGSFGDLGTFIPLFVALGRQRAIYVPPALFLAGLANVLTGWAWDVPMPVQPMKAIAAWAIANDNNHTLRHQVTAAGLWMGVLMVALGATGGVDLVNRLVPASVVAGMQLGVGLSLALHGVEMIQGLSLWVDEQRNPDCIVLALVAGASTLCALQCQSSPSSRRMPPPPIGLYLLLVAIVIAILKIFSHHNKDDDYGADGKASSQNTFVVSWTLPDIAAHDWLVGLTEGAIPQLPLTTLNSVISVCALAHTLFPEKRRRQQHNGEEQSEDSDPRQEPSSSSLDAVLSRREVAVSVGVLNCLACPLGGMPNCHGAGGLAGQHKLGARHGASIVFLGSLKMVLAVAMGAAVLRVMDAFPLSILGVMLIMAGQELALTGLVLSLRSPSSSATMPNGNGYYRRSSSVQEEEEDLGSDVRDRIAIALLTAIIILGTKKTHYGAAAGLIAHWIYHQRTCSWQRRRYSLAATEDNDATV